MSDGVTDFTPSLCKLLYSFDEPHEKPNDLLLFSLPPPTPPNIRITLSTDYPNDVYYQFDETVTEKIEELNDLRSRITDRAAFDRASAITNPFEIGRSIFPMSEYSVILANIDAIHNITRVMRYATATQPYNPSDLGEPGVNFRFCSLCDGPGGFTKYLQYRRPKSYGFGMSKYEKKDFRKQNWQPAELDMNRFEILEDDDHTGDLTKHYPRILQHVKGMGGTLVDLVVANGGVRQEEFASTRLILTEIYIALMILDENGDAVIRVTDLNTILMVEVIYLLTYAFDIVRIFKPCSSNVCSMERYLVCRYRNKGIEWVTQTFERILQVLAKGDVISSIIDGDIDISFIAKIHTFNYYHMRECIQDIKDVMDYMESGIIYKPRHDFDRFLIYWALPSNLQLVTHQSIDVVSSSKLGQQVFEAYHYQYTTHLSKITDKTEYNKAIVDMRSKLNRLIYGIDEKLPLLPISTSWSHVRVGDFYTFTNGPFVYKCVAVNIDRLLNIVSGDWEQVYKLVERYYPFSKVFLDGIDDPGAILAFGCPLVHVGGKYCSLYKEDKVFGSLGVVMDVFPTINEGDWIFYNHASDIVILNVARICLEKKPTDVRISIYTSIQPNNPMIKEISKIVQPQTVQVVLYDHGKQTQSTPLYRYLFRK